MNAKGKRTFRIIKKADKYAVGVFVDKEGFVYPLTDFFSDLSLLEEAVKELCVQLNEIVIKAKKDIDASTLNLKVSSEMSPEEVWNILTKIKDEQEFIKAFNSLKEEKRREVADFVFSKCNVFSGKGAIFSFRYNNTTAMLE
jgi:hypothetical protein